MPFSTPDLTAPVATKRETIRVVHGVTLSDPYAWLRADNWQEVMRKPETLAADIRAHLEAENAYAEAALSSLQDLKATLVKEMRGRIKEDDASVPAPDGVYAYGTRYRDGGQHPLFVRTSREGGEEAVLLDGDALAEGKAYFKFGGASHSDDHTKMAWSADDKGSEKYTLRIRDLAIGEDLPDTIEETSSGGVWSADGQSVFYTRLDDNHRPSKVFRHRIGDDPSNDALIYEETDPGFFVGIGRTQSGRFLVVDCHDHQTSEVWLLDLEADDAALTCVAEREIGHEYSVEHQGDRLVILTNANGAEDFKIVDAPVSSPGKNQWNDLVAHAPGRLILGHLALADWLIWLERADGLPRLCYRSADGKTEAVAFDEEAYALGIGTNFEFATDTLRFSYSSPTTPQSTVDVNLKTGEQAVRKVQEVPSGHDPADYRVRRLFATAEDGAEVPITVLSRANHADDSSAPCLLYGYGSYGISIPASFSTNALSLVDRGFVYAIAHIRGGKDKGFAWYKQGKAEHKVNTFTDFIAARDHLVSAGIANDAKIIAQGGSAGGMLMGAVVNIAPEKFAGIIAQVPFVDVLNTMLDDTLPLTPPEWPEWGNPIEDEAAFHRIKDYSPYDGVAAQSYPAIFALAGLTDPRVTYWEPAKWVARLRELSTSEAPILLKTNMDAGHGGAAGRFDRLDEIGEVFAFALATAGRSAST
ncbi:MAG: S9 family peptidase [Rhizobiales bacterium]|nr:S9 family peptidase [Hyphomicrobiales bacterium]MBO6698736.1 S9 family peptidase [Hyphomicrobiales bacterium]MBO6735011.1 S9 family peptidase [Hyphomicrobiales bacterium]MBO6911183.1 S9 family peptidase [Hyphomicrobiales bacterium]MBO6955693.1 S9 family peptidase [Hyphomicrobiales bacterium]